MKLLAFVRSMTVLDRTRAVFVAATAVAVGAEHFYVAAGLAIVAAYSHLMEDRDDRQAPE